MKVNAVISALRSMPRAAICGKKLGGERGLFFKIALLMNFSWAQTKPLLFYKKGANEALQILKMSLILCRVLHFYLPHDLGNYYSGKLNL